jgi:hypothetical protein
MSDAKVVDLNGAALRLRELGFSSASVWTVRDLIAKKRLVPIPCGRKFFVSIEQLDALATAKTGKR